MGPTYHYLWVQVEPINIRPLLENYVKNEI